MTILDSKNLNAIQVHKMHKSSPVWTEDDTSYALSYNNVRVYSALKSSVSYMTPELWIEHKAFVEAYCAKAFEELRVFLNTHKNGRRKIDKSITTG